LSGAQPGDFPHLSHAPGLRLHCSAFYLGSNFINCSYSVKSTGI
jgi:hypothetical protein